MFHIFNCFIPLGVFTLAELRAGLCQVVLLLPFGWLAARACRHGPSAWLVLLGYSTAMFFFQRRLASGLPVRYHSLRAWRSSPDNFRHASHFLKGLRAKPKMSATGLGARPVVVITGGERGIGQQVVEQLARECVDVILCCPFEEAAERTIRRLRSRLPNAQITFLKLNLNDEASVRSSAAAILSMTPRIDILINNAGIVNVMGHKANRHGNEVVLAVNFLGHVLLTELLLDRVKASGASRILNVASLLELNACLPGPCHTALEALATNCDPASPYHSHNYSLSKLLMVCYTRDLAQRLRGTETCVVSLHPGVVLTNIYHVGAVFMRLFLRTVFKFPGEGAEVVLFCALADKIQSGAFYADCTCRDDVVSPLALDATHNTRLRRVLLRYFQLDGAEGTGAVPLPEVVASVE